MKRKKRRKKRERRRKCILECKSGHFQTQHVKIQSNYTELQSLDNVEGQRPRPHVFDAAEIKFCRAPNGNRGWPSRADAINAPSVSQISLSQLYLKREEELDSC